MEESDKKTKKTKVAFIENYPYLKIDKYNKLEKQQEDLNDFNENITFEEILRLGFRINLDIIKEEENLINKYENEHNALIEKEKNCKINLKKQSNMLNKLRDDIGNINNDNESIKKYIYFMKISVDLNNKQTINDYIELWNFYLDVYMNDPDAYNELAQIYLMANEYDKAIFCLEELLLHSPDDYKIMNKLGDIYCSKNNSADAKIAIKYYSQSVLINPTPRAFFGIQNSANIIIQKEKKLDDKVKKLVDISKNELTKLYGETSFKDFDVNKIFRV